MILTRGGQALAAAALLLMLAWVAGFAVYLENIASLSSSASGPESAFLPAPEPQATEQTAIVVLTGGSERIATGLRLLQQGYGRKLFISGAGPGIGFAKIFAGLPRDEKLEACCITLGHMAGDTEGNASETEQWLDQTGFRRVILVTSHYHMLRSLLEFRDHGADQRMLLAFPIAPARVQIADWWLRPRTALLLMTEYSKLLVTLLRYGWHQLS